MHNFSSSDVAIIGVSGLFPGANTLAAFAQLLAEGQDMVRTVSPGRLTDARCDASKNYRPIGFLESVDKFDHSFFGISKSEAESIDPVQRIVLELVYGVFENAGYSPAAFKGQSHGVFMGGLGSAYSAVSGIDDGVAIIGNTNGIIAGRVAYMLDLRGPVMMLDTTCSSALTAVYEACQHIRQGRVKMAVAGSFTVQNFFAEMQEESPLNTMSPDGKCKPFDQSANGIGSGEGGGVILLKSAAEAFLDGDHIYAVIKGMAMNSDGGLSNGLTAPSPEAQKQVILEAWADAGINPNTIGYIEAHGTGTKLGDPIEFQALTEAFRKHGAALQSCALGAVKGNFGHLDHAAGMAGIFKLICSLQNGKLYPSLHFTSPNPFLDYTQSALFVNTTYKDWLTDGHSRRAGISAFGLSGTNVHLVLEAYEPFYEQTKDLEHWGSYFLKLSAKTPAALQQYKIDVANYLEALPATDVISALHTLNICRGDYEHRLTIRGTSIEQLISALRDANLPTFKQKAQSAVTVLLSNEAVPPAIVNYIIQINSDFKSVHDTVMADAPGAIAPTLAGQLVWLLFLDQIKIDISRVVATGIGKLAQRIFNDRSLLQQITKLTAEGIHELPTDKMKVDTLAGTLATQDSSTLLLRVSNNCSLSRMITQAAPVLRAIQPNSAAFDASYMLQLIFEQGITAHIPAFRSILHFAVKPAPTYPFQKIRCWFPVEEASKVQATGEHLLYEHRWKEITLAKGHPISQKVLVLFTGINNFATNVFNLLASNNTIIQVNNGAYFEKISATQYNVNINSLEDYIKLERAIATDFPALNGIVDVLGCDVKNDENILAHAFNVTKAFATHLLKRQFGVYVATSGIYNLINRETSEVAAAWGAWKGILSDFLHVDMRVVDFVDEDTANNAASFIDAITASHEIKFSKFVDKKHYVQALHPYKGFTSTNEGLLQQPGTYIITGGLGRIGRIVCRFLADKHHHLIVIGQRAIENDIEKSAFVKELQQKAASFTYYAAPLNDREKLMHVVKSLSKELPPVQAVLHLAGIADDFVPLQDKTWQNFERTLSPKVAGTRHLFEATASLEPSLFLCFSSLNAIIPKKFSADYAAANCFEDHFVQKIGLYGRTRLVSINWPGWDVFDEPGNGIGADEGMQVMQQAISSGLSNIVVSKPKDIAYFSINPFFQLEDTVNNHSSEPNINRLPIVQSVEELIAQIWQEVLKADDIQLDDDFFDIGGHSLNGTQVLNRVNKQFNVLLDMDDFFEYGTIQAMANIVKERMPVQVKPSLNEEIAQIWKDVLKADDIQFDDDFFDIGGHSLNGTQVLNRVNKQFNVSLDMDDFFEYGTIKAMAKIVEERMPAQVHQLEKVDNDIIPTIPISEHYATSAMQQTFYINSQLQEGSRIFNMVLPFFIKGNLNKTALEQSISYLLDRHESLRTRFSVEDGELRQAIMSLTDIPLPVTYESADPAVNWDYYPQREHDRLFDISSDLLLRVNVVAYSEERHLFVLTVHHLVTDGWSQGVLLAEFLQAYDAFSKNEKPALPALGFQYKDYVVWLENELQRHGSEELDYWEKKLQGNWPMFEEPVTGNEASKWKAGTLKFALSSIETQALKQFAKQQDTTLFMLLLAISKVVLHQAFGWNDVVVGTVTSGRIHPSLENQIGNFLNTIALRDQVRSDMTFVELLASVRQTTLEAFRHQTVPFTKVIEHRLGTGVQWRERWMEVQVNLHNYVQVEDHIKAADFLELPAETTDYDFDTDWSLHFNCMETAPNELSIYINYNKNMLEDAFMHRMKDHVQQLIPLLLKQSTSPLHTFPNLVATATI
ncbi:ketoacyl-synthetase-like protein [Chitinophaga skermanii]|uniref:Ketoacyl-synthetase-like protein n=1 Tax=Chitinophaga skermanii TaxID=331697 RepID=A0A327R628_9BACT|nr:SDR family NAD(P)-dependent oxidoreductase [Chitinophaga skermanii]RAJ11144.1 ketoacyl-synthetase-like protein [Chitinophaga skermanii]